MKTPKSLILPEFTEIKDLKQAEEIIRQLIKAIEQLNQFVRGDVSKIEETSAYTWDTLERGAPQ